MKVILKQGLTFYRGCVFYGPLRDLGYGSCRILAIPGQAVSLLTVKLLSEFPSPGRQLVTGIDSGTPEVAS
jgi:hypothetical protein